MGAEYAGCQPESAPTILTAVKDDPIFKGLPRYPRFPALSNHDHAIKDAFRGVGLIASSEVCKAHIFHYRGKPWYTFQAHIEQGWSHVCPEAMLLWKNLLRYFFLAA